MTPPKMLWFTLLRYMVLAASPAAPVPSPDDLPPSIVFVGDPHLNNTPGQPTTWQTQTAWIAANISAWNIKAILSAGDFDGGTINGPADSAPNVTLGWNDGWNTIDGTGLPYLMTVGNHDYSNNQPATRDTTVFDAQLGWGRIHSKSFFGGFYNDGANSKANEWITFDVGTHHLLVLALELFPRPAVMTWADSVIQAHMDKEVIVITHGYIQTGSGALLTEIDQWGPETYILPNDSYSGEQLATWAAKWPNNVRMIICGHNDPPNYFRRQDGRTYGIMSDYQTSSPASQVILIIQFNATTVTINNYNTTTQTLDVTTYPPDTVVWPIPPAKPTYVLGGNELR